MSYILEALKRSQQERELGQVPRLHPPFYETPVASAAPRPWLFATLALAALAAVLAGYAVFRGGPATDAPVASREASAPVVAPTAVGAPTLTGDAASPTDDLLPAARRAAGQGAVDPRPGPSRPVEQRAAASQPANADRAADPTDLNLAGASVDDLDPAEPTPVAPDMTGAAPADPIADAGTPADTSTPSNVSTSATAEPAAIVADDPAPAAVSAPAPQVLVVPAPPKPGEPLPRGADELRRAVLGDAGLGGASLPPPAPPRQTIPASTPIPDDLINDIQAFKRQVGMAPASPPAVAPKLAAAAPASLPRPPALAPTERPAVPTGRASADADAADRPPPASTALLQRMPTLTMSVHVYNTDPDQRFVYANGSKLRERQRTRDGLRLEQVRADGAVFSFDGERFFQPR